MNDAEERRARAAARLRTVTWILDELEVRERWEPHGELELIGSVGLELVVRPDIDLEVYTDGVPSPAAGFAAVAPMAERPNVSGIRFKNCLDLPEQGLYWKLEYMLDGQHWWTIDMWMFARDRPGPTSAQQVAAIRQVLTDDARDTILAIKEEAAAAGERAHGHWLYQAVLNEGVTDYAGYSAWIGDQDVWERTEWSPR